MTKQSSDNTGFPTALPSGRIVLTCLLVLLAFVATAPASLAQDSTPAALQAAGEKYTVAQAEGKKSATLVGKAIATIAVQSGYKSKAGFVLEDLGPSRERVAVYTDGSIPAIDQLVTVQGTLLTDMVPINDRRKERLFVSIKWSSGTARPQEDTNKSADTGTSPSAEPVSSSTEKSTEKPVEKSAGETKPGNNNLLYLLLGLMVVGIGFVVVGYLQQDRKRKPSPPLLNPLEGADPIPVLSRTSRGEREEPYSASGYGSPSASGGVPEPPMASPVSPVPVAPAPYTVPPYATPEPITPEVVSVAEAGVEAGDVFFGPEGRETVGQRGETLSALAGYFEVVSGGAEIPGARKTLFSAAGRHSFDIARPANGQDLIANFIPIKSALVSRNAENQGKVFYNPLQDTYILRNLADPAQRKNPIKVGGVPMKPGEEHLLLDGDLVQIGDVTLRFRRL